MDDVIEVPGRRRVAQALQALGVRHVFGVMGIGNVGVVAEHVGLGGRYVAARHEAGAVNMADGVHRATGRIGVATVIQGPGLTNAITAITTAARSGSAILVITSEIPMGPVPVGQAIDQRMLVSVTGAAYVCPTNSDPALAVVEAARQAVAERRPVVLALPGSLQRSDFVDEPVFVPVHAIDRVPPEDDDIAEVVSKLDSAERPVILAGRGASRAEASGALADLADRTGALLGTTLLSKDLFVDRPDDLGILGGFSHDLARHLLSEADLILAFGTSLSPWTTKRRHLFPAATLIQIDNDPRAFSGTTKVDLTVEADAGLVADELVRRCADRRHRGWDDDGSRERLALWRRADDIDAYSSRTGIDDDRAGLDPRQVCVTLGASLPAGRRLVTDSGHHFGFPIQYIPVDNPDHYHHTASFGAIGQGLGISIGAALADPSRASVVVLGDGGLAISIADLETAVRERVPMLIVVLDDHAYSAEVHHLRRAGIPEELGRFDGPDLCDVARGFGCDARRVDTLDQLAAVVEGWSGAEPLLVVVPTDGDVLARWYAEVLPTLDH